MQINQKREYLGQIVGEQMVMRIDTHCGMQWEQKA